jgi:nuclear transport factor 2 (NTF2) superfamily protein
MTTAVMGSLVPQRAWEFDGHGLMRRRIASINDLRIADKYRKYF